MIDSVICMGANAFRVYLISRLLNAFFRTGETTIRKIFLAYGVFYAVNTFLYLSETKSGGLWQSIGTHCPNWRQNQISAP